MRLTAALADRAAQTVRGAHGAPALLALDRENRAEARAAIGTPCTHLGAARRARGWQLGLVRFEVALRVTAREAEGDPVAERLAALFAEPVRGLAHCDQPTPKPLSF